MKRMMFAALAVAVLLGGCSSNDDEGQLVNGIWMEPVVEGSFEMGSDTGAPDQAPQHTVEISELHVGKREVTNRQYAAYLNEALGVVSTVYGIYVNEAQTEVRQWTGSEEADEPVLGNLYLQLKAGNADSRIVYDADKETFSAEEGYEDKPVTFVSWYGANAFAYYYDLRLPTEAEWEYVARAGEQLEYPTGATIDCEMANYACESPVGAPTDVGSYPANPHLLYDLAGNVKEWCLDWYGADFYGVSPVKNPYYQDDASGTRVVRGGSYADPAELQLSALRGSELPETTSAQIGFRVVLR